MAARLQRTQPRRRPGQEAALGLYGEFRLIAALRYCVSLMLAAMRGDTDTPRQRRKTETKAARTEDPSTSPAALNTMLPRIYAGR